jgi:GR25 family glycosyltransferase involved in LPS biosynthesis
MDTLLETIENLRREGYIYDLKLAWNYLECTEADLKILHDEFMIDKFYRFEGMSDPDDEATVYAISSPAHRIKGVLINGGGIYTDDIADEMLAALQIKG